MRDRQENHGRPGGENQRIGKELYNEDKKLGQQRYGYRGPRQRDWDEGNYFHTGPSPRGAQDRNRREDDYPRGGSSHSTYEQGRNAHLGDHYGSQPGSHYRNEQSYLNHGDRGNPHLEGLGNAGGSQPGNYNEPPAWPDKLHREGPQTRSRYKESDYRYGSGSHNWYREGRYSPDEDRTPRDNRGFFDRIRDGWNDIMHADDPEYQDRNRYDRHADNLSSRKRYGSEPYRDRGFDNNSDQYRNRDFDSGYEGGPRWADEVDSGKDNQYKDTDRDQRFRR